MWKKTRAWAEYADYDSKYTLQVSKDTLVAPPTSLSTETYRFSGRSYIYDRRQSYDVTIGYDGDDIYIKGIFKDVPDAWIKGSKKGNTYIFPHGQLLGKTHTGTTNYYMIACNHRNTSEIQGLVLNIDSTDAYSTGQYLVLNTAKNTVYLTEALDSVVIKKVIKGNAYDVPFSESFDGGLNGFTIIDVNNDSVTWRLTPLGQTVEYSWSDKNNADDWLITPAIRLQSGKKYTFSLKARSFTASTPEKFEVKIGTTPTADAMTTQIIDTTVVATEDKTDFSSTFSVDADGTYNIGIHAVSDKGNMILTVDDISVTEATLDGINKVSTVRISVNAPCYNVAGQRVGNNYKGIVIQNGRKFIRR